MLTLQNIGTVVAICTGLVALIGWLNERDKAKRAEAKWEANMDIGVKEIPDIKKNIENIDKRLFAVEMMLESICARLEIKNYAHPKE